MDGAWTTDTLAYYDARNEILGISRQGVQLFFGQPFVDYDLAYVDPRTGVAGIVQRNERPGEVHVLEVAPREDTVFSARIPVLPVPVERARIDEAIEATSEKIDRYLGPLPPDTVRQIAEEALHLPSHLSAVTAVVAAASGELWMRTREVVDTLVVWYAVERRDSLSVPRRILLPTWFQLHGATGTHAWGRRRGAGVSVLVEARKLVPGD